MALLLVGLVLFLGVHSVAIVAPRWRTRLIGRLGARLWKAEYSVVALIGLVVLVDGYGIARQTPAILYAPPTWLRHAALLLMVPVFPLLVSTYLPGRISRAAKHPMLLAVKFWALAHLLANGTANDVVLFAAFLVWAVADRISVKRRASDERHDLLPARRRPYNDVGAIVIGLAIYAAFLAGVHRWLIGVSPLG